jgi:hypothetical protein
MDLATKAGRCIADEEHSVSPVEQVGHVSRGVARGVHGAEPGHRDGPISDKRLVDLHGFRRLGEYCDHPHETRSRPWVARR